MKRTVHLQQPQPLDKNTLPFAAKLLATMRENITPAEVNRQAMMVQHFNQLGGGKSVHSHDTLGTKFRRYGR